jgi:hypothetical protein
MKVSPAGSGRETTSHLNYGGQAVRVRKFLKKKRYGLLIISFFVSVVHVAIAATHQAAIDLFIVS